MSTHFTTLQIERRGGVATVWMNRPDKHNAFNEALIAELDAAFAQLDADAAVRAVVLAGRGKSFSAGADLRWMKAQGEASEAANVADARRLADMLARLATLGKPTLARVHGAALGGGMGLAAACDICVASARAVFAPPRRGRNRDGLDGPREPRSHMPRRPPADRKTAPGCPAAGAIPESCIPSGFGSPDCCGQVGRGSLRRATAFPLP